MHSESALTADHDWMDPSVSALFECTRVCISRRHIVDFSPGDPGYDSYVRKWTRILDDGKVPRESEFDLSEVIALTGWVSNKYAGRNRRFREYRRFTSAVAVALVCSGNCSDSVRVSNYLARDLVVDVERTDGLHLACVRNVLPVVRQALIGSGCEGEYPFFSLASLILADTVGDYQESAVWAGQLIRDEAEVRRGKLDWQVESSKFLFGLTIYDQLNTDWRRLVTSLSNPEPHQDIQRVVEALS